jgi:hypothetical protein
MPKQNKQPKKKSYDPPQLRVIEILEGPEVLATGCKLLLGGTDFGASPCVANACAQAGS